MIIKISLRFPNFHFDSCNLILNFSFLVTQWFKELWTLNFFSRKIKRKAALNQSDLFFFVFFFLRRSCSTFLINKEILGTKMALLLPSPWKTWSFITNYKDGNTIVYLYYWLYIPACFHLLNHQRTDQAY
jgi:hypothetical protein